MNIILYDGAVRNQLLPFTYTRPVCELRIGILTIKEKWELFLGTTATILTEAYLEEKFPMLELEQNVFVDAAVLPTPSLAAQVKSLKKNQLLASGEEVIAFYTMDSQNAVDFDAYDVMECSTPLVRLEGLTCLYAKNDWALRADFELLTAGCNSQTISKTNRVLCPENIFIEEGAVVEYATLNASSGPIYIGKDAVVMENTSIRGPFSLGEQSVVKMGTTLYGATTIGPKCIVGGEVKNSVIFENSNKSHHGYLGNSVVGAWCNLGAGTSVSNMKNTLSDVFLWNGATAKLEATGKQFCGSFIGDHCTTAIHTAFNTGTVVGVCTNIFGDGTPEKSHPSFSWGTGVQQQSFQLDKAKEIAVQMYSLKKEVFTEVDARILEAVYKLLKKPSV
jgi:UDP-N-acetylglucosamine diphosphorylase/glucosamine-1-phosphate N-acetyltransferase